MSEEIKIKKSDLWKYSTVILLVVIIVGGILVFSGKGSTNNGNTGASNGGTGSATVDVSGFLSDTSLYPSLGPNSAKHVVVEFADFQCPYCALASGLPAWSSRYASQYGDLVDAAGKIEDMARSGNVEFVYVPMSFLGQESVYAAQAALCANQQGKFWEMHDAIFKASDGPSEDTGKYTKANLTIIAQGVGGLDMQKFNDCLNSDKTLSDVQKVASAASSSGVTGTPSFFVDGKQVSASWTAISSALA